MLNEPLFRAMMALFKQTPVIVNEDVRATIHYPPPRASFVSCLTQISARDVKGGEQYAVNCPFCEMRNADHRPDTRHRLYVSAMWNVKITFGSNTYICSDRLLRCFNEECMQVDEYRNWVIKGLTDIMQNKTVMDSVTLVEDQRTEVDADSLANQVPLPPHMADIDHPSVPQYVRDYWFNVRGFTKDHFDRFGVKIAYMPYPIRRGCALMEQPVTIIPVYQYGKYWFFQARLIPIDGDPAKGYERNMLDDEYPKYYIPATAKKSWSLYNLDNAASKEEIVVVEGPTDVWRIGDRAVAKFGRSLSSAQRGIMSKVFRGKSIILLPDMDDPLAYEEACKDQTILQNSGDFKSVQVAVLEKGKDPGDMRMSEDEIWEYIQNNLNSLGGSSLDGSGLRGLL